MGGLLRDQIVVDYERLEDLCEGTRGGLNKVEAACDDWIGARAGYGLWRLRLTMRGTRGAGSRKFGLVWGGGTGGSGPARGCGGPSLSEGSPGYTPARGLRDATLDGAGGWHFLRLIHI